VVAEIADRIVVMYAGKVMERGGVFEIFEQPAHPYTQALMRCLPGKGGGAGGIKGSLPDPTDPPDGCRFAPRCEHATDYCEKGEQPDEIEVDVDHNVSCIYYGPGYDSDVVRDSQLESDGDASEVSVDE
jgi:peptide/nickel transport system ATP-binding protein